MAVQNKKKLKRKKFFSLLLLSAAVIASFFYIVHFSSADLNFSGFGWIGNDLTNGSDTGEPAGGWLSFSYEQTSCGGSAYAVTLGGNQGDNDRDVKGYAWFGIGSVSDPYSATLSGLTCQNDAESLGWVDFQAGSPSFCPGECHSAQWHRTGSDYQGYIDGWAKVVSMGDDGWIRLKGSNYGLSLQQDGLATGDSYGWNSGGGDANVGNNAGLGWIKFANAEICSIAFPSASQTISETATSLALDRNRAAGFSVIVNLSANNPSGISFPTNPVTFPSGQTSYYFPISITPLPDNVCSDNSVIVTAQSICGQSQNALTIQQSCSISCLPEDITIMPGETMTFTATGSGYTGEISWTIAGNDLDCVDPTKTSCSTGSSCTIGIYENTPGGKNCAMKSFRVTAKFLGCEGCGSGTCGLDVSRPGWVETNP